MQQLDCFTPPSKPAARRLTLLLNLSAPQVADLAAATSGPLDPDDPRWESYCRLIRRGLLGSAGVHDGKAYCALTPFGSAALAAYRAAEEAGLLREVA